MIAKAVTDSAVHLTSAVQSPGRIKQAGKTSNYNEEYKTQCLTSRKSLIAVGILTALVAASAATAADVPAGVQLADKQTLVRNNGSRRSPDPIKLKACRNRTSADLFEGLLIAMSRASFTGRREMGKDLKSDIPST